MRGAGFETIPDREAAIRHAVNLAAPRDIVLIAGKGHENYQMINGVKHEFDDKTVAKSFLQKPFYTIGL